ncbi:MAG: hypothetical protein AAF074_06800 [Pseudomonadota bacterium]
MGRGPISVSLSGYGSCGGLCPEDSFNGGESGILGTISAVPLPAKAVLLIGALAGLGAVAVRRRA